MGIKEIKPKNIFYRNEVQYRDDGQLLKQGLDWDWTGTGLELDWSNLANSCRLMQARAYSDEI